MTGLPTVRFCLDCGVDEVGDVDPELRLWRCRACGTTKYVNSEVDQ
jgi:hypothetical protein